jgi:hypothetical protein
VVTDTQPASALGRIWDWFADTSCRGYSPLYDRICRAAARDEEVLDLVRAAPEESHIPNVLLAAVHYLLLSGLDHPLAAVYAGASDADPWPGFREICFAHRAEIASLMETRRTNTNECGRSAVIGPALTWVAAHIGAPLAICDVGASAGLNMGCDRYLLDYGAEGATGPAASPVRIECTVTGGQPPIAPLLPPIAARVGLDRSPVDLSDEDDARWLLACTWPDTGRLDRTRAAIRDAQQHPPTIRRGDMAADVFSTVAELPRDATVCVLTTWAVAYLSRGRRLDFAAELARAGRERPVVWISGEAPNVVPAFAELEVPTRDIEASILGAHVSSRANDRYIRPVLVAVLTISSLKLLNVSNGALLGASGVAIVALATAYLVSLQRSRSRSQALEREAQVLSSV